MTERNAVGARWALLSGIALAMLVVGGAGAGAATSAARPEVLVRTKAAIHAIAADGNRLVWTEAARGCGSRFVLLDLARGQRASVDGCRPVPGWRCCASRPALAGSTVAWQLWSRARGADRFRVVAARPGGSAPRSLGETAFARYEGPSGVALPLPVIGAAGELSFLTFCDTACQSGTGMTLWVVRRGRLTALRRLHNHLEHKVFGASERRVAVQGVSCGCIGSPVWSPDGRRFAYATSRNTLHGGPQDIYVSSAASGRPRRLTKRPLVTGEIDWSSGGRLIFEGGAGSIYLIDPDGRNLRRLTGGVDPAWSPSGREFAFSRAGRIYVQPLAGGPARSVARGRQPTWAPDGRRLAYDRGGALFVTEVEGGRERRLVTPGDPELPWELEPEWSPDGEWIAFADLDRDDKAQIYAVRPDGSERRRLTAVADTAEAPTWSPRGELTYVGSEPGRAGARGGRNIYTLASQGRPVRLTHDGPSRSVLVAIDTRTRRTVGSAAVRDDVSAVGVSRRYLVAVHPDTTRRLELFSVGGRRLGALRLPAAVSSVSAAGRFVLAKGAGRAYLVDVSRRTVRRIGSSQIADAVLLPTRVIWAENVGGAGRVLAIDLPA